jgi:hypothetical protein
VRENNATWKNGKEWSTWRRPSSPTATYVLRLRSSFPPLFTEPLRSFALSHLLSRPYPYSNLWLPSTLPILPSYHHHHHHALQSPPLHLLRQSLPPSLQQNLVLHPHPIKMAPRLESDPGLTLHLRSARRPAPAATESQPRTAVTSAKHNFPPWRLA